MLKKPLTIFLSCIAMLTACGEPVPVATSTLITNAVIHDGSGGEPIHGAVRIDGDRIVGVGDFEPLDGETVIDAGGYVLAPGFIDTHSHHDRGMAEYRHMPGVLSQGYLVAMIHHWAPEANIKAIDTVFRAPVIADDKHTITGVITDINEEEGVVEIDLTVTNEKGETRVFGTATVSLPN